MYIVRDIEAKTFQRDSRVFIVYLQSLSRTQRLFLKVFGAKAVQASMGGGSFVSVLADKTPLDMNRTGLNIPLAELDLPYSLMEKWRIKDSGQDRDLEIHMKDSWVKENEKGYISIKLTLKEDTYGIFSCTNQLHLLTLLFFLHSIDCKAA